MKQLTKLLILILIVNPFGTAFAQKKTPSSVEGKEALSVVQVKSIKESLSKEKVDPKDLNAAYDGIAQLVSNRGTIPMKDLMELCLLFNKHNTSDAVFGLILTLKMSDEKEFNKALRMLSKANAKKVEDLVELAQGSNSGL